MDCSSGRLMALAKNLKGDVELPPGFDPVPPDLALCARMKLAGRPEAQVNMRGTTPLALWAKKKRREKMAATSRRKNRK
jgi:hypothetical protein